MRVNRASVELGTVGVVVMTLFFLITGPRSTSSWERSELSERRDDERAVWLGCGISVAATLVLTTVAAALESTVNSPGSRSIAPPVLWAFGGGLGLCIGASVTAWLTRRVGPGILAAFVGMIPFLVLVIIAYNDESLRFEDQFVGSLVIVVLPGLVAAILCAFAAAYAARLLGNRQSVGVRKSVTT
jgi:hypothetical protein